MPTAAPTHQLSPDNFVTTTPFCEKFGVARSAIPRLVSEGLPAFKLDKMRWVFPLDECETWLRGHGYLVDPYRTAIKKLVDAAPPLTAEQAAKIRAILGGAA
ncbi:hypothetical protein C3469_26330 [Mycobacterium kansasii]|uniref:helix-turn-helix transcriptional regulator n=1 Tax=Mycobacterium kansasii TaxID=1768 RepID=UPI000CDD0326|nr:hypothetical protein [Mycobacterium kansasii]POX91026.1 hypothetical protein C3B43_04560 [Mycobacterium kansasii]POX96652.1 hypothetical protein C3477_25430 [Mycobacterium kansasii]POY02970.1 hypothetical protein C3479_07440 [Mycobacterium kansasii]POY19090.1 hypothetical protein C3469_26330 [Mycobacterium kansasii]POY23185.1 hypothetical protein C3476_08525 [Mycobacterium kansasii]